MNKSCNPRRTQIHIRCLRFVGLSLLFAGTAMVARAQTKTPSANSSEKARTVPYELKLEELKYVFGPLPPVMRVHAGDIIDTTTVDADGKALEAAGLKVVRPNPLTGPFYVEGAEPGDALVVYFTRMRMNRNWGFSSYRLGLYSLLPESIEGLYSSSYKPGQIIKERDNVVPWDIDLVR